MISNFAFLAMIQNFVWEYQLKDYYQNVWKQQLNMETVE